MKKVLFILFFFPAFGFTQISQNVDSLLHLVKTTSGAQKVYVLNTLAFLYSDTAFNKSIEYATLANQTSIEIDDKPGEAIALKFIGFGHEGKGDYEQALEYYEKSLSIQKILQNDSEILTLLNSMGIVFKKDGNFTLGIEYLIQAARKQDAMNDTTGLAMSYSNIGNIYLKMEDYPQALAYYKKCYDLVVLLENQYGIGLSLMNIGMVQSNLKVHEKANKSYEEAIKIFLEIDALYPLAATYGNYAELLSHEGHYAQAIAQLDKAVMLLDRLKNKSQLAEAFLMYGKIYTKIGDYKTAIDYFTKALAEAKENNQKTALKESYQELAKVWAVLHNYKNAFTFNTLFHQLKDSLVNTETRKQISDIQTKYETEKKERENVLLKSENEIASMKLDTKNKTIVSLIVVMVLFAFFIGVIIIEYSTKRKAYNHLVKQNLLLAKSERDYAVRDIQDEGDQTEETTTENLKASKFANENDAALIHKIEQLMLEEKPFLYSGINLDEICQKLNTNRTYLSNVINSHFGKNFNEFVNDYRIKVARQMLADPGKNHFSIEGIGQMSGFNSRSTFFTCFKKATGITPSYYRNSVKSIKS